VWWFILAHIGLPVGFGVVFVIISAATAPRSDEWDVLAETALDFTILSLGATGAVFENPQVARAFGTESAIVAATVIVVNLILFSLIVLARAIVVRRNGHFKFWRGILVMFLGVLTLGVTSGTLIWAYIHGRP
jgi:hypothetical protein